MLESLEYDDPAERFFARRLDELLNTAEVGGSSAVDALCSFVKTANKPLIAKHADDIVLTLKEKNRGIETIASLLPEFCITGVTEYENGEWEWKELMPEAWDLCLGPKASSAVRGLAITAFEDMHNDTIIIADTTATLLLAACWKVDNRIRIIEQILSGAKNKGVLWPILRDLLLDQPQPSKEEFAEIGKRLLEHQPCLTPEQKKEWVTLATEGQFASLENFYVIANYSRHGEDLLGYVTEEAYKRMATRFFDAFRSNNPQEQNIAQKSLEDYPGLVNRFVACTNAAVVAQWVEKTLNQPQLCENGYAFFKIEGEFWNRDLVEKLLNTVTEGGRPDRSCKLCPIVAFALRHLPPLSLLHPKIKILLQLQLSSHAKVLLDCDLNALEQLQKRWPEILKEENVLRMILEGNYNRSALPILFEFPQQLRPEIIREFVVEKLLGIEDDWVGPLSQLVRALESDLALWQGLNYRRYGRETLLDEIFHGSISPTRIGILINLPKSLRGNLSPGQWIDLISPTYRRNGEQGFLDCLMRDPTWISQLSETPISAETWRATLTVLEEGPVPTLEGLWTYCGLSQRVRDKLHKTNAQLIMCSGCRAAVPIINLLAEKIPDFPFPYVLEFIHACANSAAELNHLLVAISKDPKKIDFSGTGNVVFLSGDLRELPRGIQVFSPLIERLIPHRYPVALCQYENLGQLLDEKGEEFKQQFLQNLQALDPALRTGFSVRLSQERGFKITHPGLECFALLLPPLFAKMVGTRDPDWNFVERLFLRGRPEVAKIISALYNEHPKEALYLAPDFKKLMETIYPQNAIQAWHGEELPSLARLILLSMELSHPVKMRVALLDTLLRHVPTSEGVRVMFNLPGDFFQRLDADALVELLSCGTLVGLRKLNEFLGGTSSKYLGDLLTSSDTLKILSGIPQMFIDELNQSLEDNDEFKHALLRYLPRSDRFKENLLPLLSAKISPAGITGFMLLVNALTQPTLPQAIQVLTQTKPDLVELAHSLQGEHPDHFKLLPAEVMAKILTEGDKPPTSLRIERFFSFPPEVIALLTGGGK